MTEVPSAVELEGVDDAARAAQVGGLDESLRPLVAAVGGLVVRGVGAWGDGFLSSVTGLGVRPASERSLASALGLLARIGVTAPVVSVVEGADHALPEQWLAARGFAPSAALVRLVRELDGVRAPADSPWRVEVVGPERASQVVAVCRAGFGPDVDPAWWRAGLGRPGWTQVVAYDGAVPVGTGGLFAGKGSAWIGGTATVPSHRGQGVHAAMLSLRLALAAEAGAARVGVLAGQDGQSRRNLERAGFAVAYGVRQYRRS